MDLLSRSIGVRIDLWSVALNGFTQNFPFGLGLGGYEEAIKTMGAEPSIPKLATEAHKYPHNTFLGLLAELGLLGVIFCAAILFLLFKSSKNWSIKTRIPFLAVTLLPLLIHDAHTIRLLILLIAFSFVHSNCIDNKRNA